MKHAKTVLGVAVALSFCMPHPALAFGVRYYRVEAFDTDVLRLNACSRSVEVEVNGDGDTDLDFWVYSPSGSLIHSDTDGTDITFFSLRGGDCRSYRLEVKNLGNVYNRYYVKMVDS